MNIAYFHRDVWPPQSGDSVYSWQIFSRLQKNHTLYTDDRCPFPGAVRIYHDIQDSVTLINAVDALLINTEGYFNFYIEMFSVLSLFRKKKLPVIWLTQAPLEEELLFPGSWRLFYQKYLRRQLARLVDANICVSEVMKQYCATELGIPDSRVVSNGSDPTLFHPNIKKNSAFDTFKGRYKVFWAGSGHLPWQAIDTMVNVARKMHHIDPGIVFVFIVSNSHAPLPVLDNVLYLPAVSYFQLPEILVHADAFLCLYHELLPMGFYNSPVKLFDSMSMAKPVIASNMGQIRDIITHGENGLLTNGKERDVIQKILYLKKHPSIARRLGANARKSITDTYNWDHAVSEIEAIVMHSIRHI